MAKTRHGIASGRWERWRGLVAAAALVGAVAAVFLPAVWFEFTNYDELEQVLENPLAHSVSLANIAEMFSSFCIASYYPVRLLSFAVDYRLGGGGPMGFHLTNLLIHSANVVLVFWLALRLLRRAPLFHPSALTGEGGVRVRDARKGCPEVGSTLSVTPSPLPLSSSSLSLRAEGRQGRGVFAAAVGAAIFALHPVVVEPVAWVAGREELLMVFFALVSVHLFLRKRGQEPLLRGDVRPSVAAGPAKRLLTPFLLLAGAVVAGACSAMSNIVGAVLPFMLTALCLTLPRPEAAAGVRRWPGVARGLLRTVPFWLIAVGALVVKQIGTEVTAAIRGPRPMPVLSLAERACAVLRLYALNLRSLFWPRELIPTYPMVRFDVAADGLLLAGVALVAGTVGLLWVVRRRRVVLLGLLWFLLGLAPSSQVISHHIARADRFLYLPLVGVAVALAAAGHRLVRAGGRTRAAWLLAPGLTAAAVLGVASRLQLPYWRDSIAIFGRCVEVAPGAWPAHNNLGEALLGRRQYARAAEHLQTVVRLHPNDRQAHHNLGRALAAQGDWARAAVHYRRAVEITPRSALAHAELGDAALQLGLSAEAVSHLRRALEIEPGLTGARNNLAWLLAVDADPRVRDGAEAVRHAEIVCRETGRGDPHYLDTLAVAYAAAGWFPDAVRAAEQALELAQAAENHSLARRVRARLALFRNGRAFHLPPATASGPAATSTSD